MIDPSFLDSEWSSSILSDSPVLIIDTGKIVFSFLLFCLSPLFKRVAHTPSYMFLDAEGIPQGRGIS